MNNQNREDWKLFYERWYPFFRDFELKAIYDYILERDVEINKFMLREIKQLKKDYKNNEDYRDYGTLHDNVCHDDGYMAALEDLVSLIEQRKALTGMKEEGK